MQTSSRDEEFDRIKHKIDVFIKDNNLENNVTLILNEEDY